MTTSKAMVLNLPVSLGNSARMAAFAVLSVSSFVVPFYLGYPQWLVGTLVNAFLFLSVVFLPKNLFFPLIVLPSLGVLARGVIFGSLTPFLIYFLPFIWLGNLILILSFRKMYNFNYIFSLIASATAKFLFLTLIANIYFRFSIVPQMFLQTMGILQFLTALAGGIISLIVFKTWKTQVRK